MFLNNSLLDLSYFILTILFKKNMFLYKTPLNNVYFNIFVIGQKG